MDQERYFLVKLITGDCLIGSLVETDSDTHITLSNPFIYQLISITNGMGMKIRDVLSFKKWMDFANNDEITFRKDTIISIIPANETIINFYVTELESLKNLEKLDQEKKEDTDDSEDQKGIMGNLNLNFNFENSDHFQMFIENMQISMEALLDEMNGEIDFDNEDEDNIDYSDANEFDLEDDVDLPTSKKNLPKRKKAKNRIPPKTTMDLPYEKDADPKDPKSWSNNPQDYLK